MASLFLGVMLRGRNLIMGRFTALTFASLLAVGAAQAAQAADLLPPPPIEAPPLRGAVVDEPGGFYLRADAGLANTNATNLRSTFADGTTLATLGATDGPVSVGDSGILGLGAGYQFNTWLRADVTGEYRNAINYHSSVAYQSSYAPSCLPASGISCGDEYTGQVKTGLVLANGYLDLGSWYGFSPYFGGGVGLVAYQTSAIKDNSLLPGGSFGFAPNSVGTNFAWALMAGVGYHITPNLMLDIGYRYVNMGTFNTGAITCNQIPCHLETQHFKVASNDVRVGLRWLLDSRVPVFEPGPVRAKY
jgi:opacity protein-like surface antigen